MVLGTAQGMIRSDVMWEIFTNYSKDCKAYAGEDGFFKPLCKRLDDNKSMTESEPGLKRCSILACPNCDEINNAVDKKLDALFTNASPGDIEIPKKTTKARKFRVVNGTALK